MVAFLSLACAPMPLLFHRYGARLRRHSKYAPSGPVDEDECEDKVPQPNEDDALEPEYAVDAGESVHAHDEHVQQVGEKGNRAGDIV